MKESTTTIIIRFLESIGISVIEKNIEYSCILPGLDIHSNTILMDSKKLKHPGDLLHEAGHIAATSKEERSLIGTKQQPETWPKDGDEIVAILWSYAAAKHLGIDLTVVFHDKGYKDESNWIINQLESENYIGIDLLEWMGLCKKDEFPKMKKWLRD